MEFNQDAHHRDVIKYIRSVGALHLVSDETATGGRSFAAVLPYWSRLWHWQQEAQGSMPLTSWRALQYDWRQFLQFCQIANRCPLPATPQTVRLYLLSMAKPHLDLHSKEDQKNWAIIQDELRHHGIEPKEKAQRKIATIERRAATLAKAHRAAGALNPVDTETVLTALKKIRFITDREPTQRKAIEHRHYTALLDLPVITLREHQDRLITLIGFETGLRRSRLASIRVTHVEWDYEEGEMIGALITIPKDKNQLDTKLKALTDVTAQHLQTWFNLADIKQGPVFRGITGHRCQRLGDEPISGLSIQMAMQRCMQRLGESPDLIGGHSTRIGGTQYLREQGVGLAELIAYGDWKTSAMPLRYTRKLDASQSTMRRTLQKKIK